MLSALGRKLFALAIVAFGIQQFLFGDFVPGRAPAWPAAWPGRLPWAYGSGAAFVVLGLAILVEQRARMAALVVGALIGCWALARHVPIAAADVGFGVAWTNLGKALALVGGALAVAGTSAPLTHWVSGRRPSAYDATVTFLLAGRVCLGIFLINSGIQHFLFADFVKLLVPAWIPHPMFWTYFAGSALIAGGLGLIVPLTARAAAIMTGLMVFTWLVILHIPRALAAPAASQRNEWIAVFEALAISGIAFTLTRTSREGRRGTARR